MENQNKIQLTPIKPDLTSEIIEIIKITIIAALVASIVGSLLAVWLFLASLSIQVFIVIIFIFIVIFVPIIVGPQIHKGLKIKSGLTKNRFSVKQEIEIDVTGLDHTSLIEHLVNIIKKRFPASTIDVASDLMSLDARIAPSWNKNGSKLKATLTRFENKITLKIISRPSIVTQIVDMGINQSNIAIIANDLAGTELSESVQAFNESINNPEIQIKKALNLSSQSEDTAPISKRILAYLIDRSVTVAIIMFFIILGGVVFSLSSQIANLFDPVILIFPVILLIILGAILGHGYFLLRDAIPGGSIGRRLTKTRVVDIKTGADSGIGQSLKRNIMSYFPYTMPLELLMLAQGSQKYGDTWAGTKVVSI